MLAPGNGGVNKLDYRSTGTGGNGEADITVGFEAPVSVVVTGISEISENISILRANGNQVASDATVQGGGNYGNYPLYIGIRKDTSIGFAGNTCSLVIRGAQTNSTDLDSLEQYTAALTGVTL